MPRRNKAARSWDEPPTPHHHLGDALQQLRHSSSLHCTGVGGFNSADSVVTKRSFCTLRTKLRAPIAVSRIWTLGLTTDLCLDCRQDVQEIADLTGVQFEPIVQFGGLPLDHLAHM